eukprot:2990556-Amphidinium_carterae.1
MHPSQARSSSVSQVIEPSCRTELLQQVSGTLARSSMSRFKAKPRGNSRQQSWPTWSSKRVHTACHPWIQKPGQAQRVWPRSTTIFDLVVIS